MVVQPFAVLGAPGGALPAADAVPRCAECAAYVCGFCRLERDGWVCALCGVFSPASAPAPPSLLNLSPGRFTPFAGGPKERYRRTARRGDLPELAAGSYECLVASEVVPLHSDRLSGRRVHLSRDAPGSLADTGS